VLFNAISAMSLAIAIAMASPQSAETHLQRGEAFRAAGSLDKAVEEYSEALRLRPSYAEARSGLGWALVTVSPNVTAADRAVRARKAIPEFQRALRLKPNYAEAHFGLALAHLLLSDGQPREEHLAEVNKAIPELREALRLKPDLGPAHGTLAQTLEDKGDLDGAVAEYQADLQLRPDYAKGHADLGAVLEKKGDIEGAVAEYRATLRLAPQDEATRYRLGVVLENKGDLDGAIAEYEQLNNPKVHSRLGAALLRKGARLNDAIEEFREALRVNPADRKAASLLDTALIRRDRPWAFLETEDLDLAIAGFREVVRRRTEDAEAHYQLGRALRQRNEKGALDWDLNLDLGIVAFGSRSKISPAQKQDLEDSIAELRQAVLLKPDHAEAHFSLGWALHLKSHDCNGAGSADSEYREALRLNPALVYTHAHLGWWLDMCGDPESAIAEYQEFLKTIPDDDKVHYALGWALLQRGYPYWNAAANEFADARRLRPDHVDAEFAREAMFALRDMGPPFLDQYEAKGNLATYWKMDSRNANARYGAGWAHTRKLEFDPAYRDFLAAVTLKPDFAEARCSGGYVLYLWARRSRNPAFAEQAAAVYELALRLRPDFAEAHHGLGMALLEQAKQYGDTTKKRTAGDEKGIELADRAITEFRQALLLRPEFGQAHFGLGWALDFKSDLQGAEAEYREATRLMPSFAYAHVRLGRLLEAKGDATCAEAEFQQALRVQPDYPRNMLH